MSVAKVSSPTESRKPQLLGTYRMERRAPAGIYLHALRVLYRPG